MSKIIVVYVPVLHEGYRRFFEKHAGSKVYLLGRDVANEYRSLLKDVRALDPELIKKSLEALGWASEVEVLSVARLGQLAGGEPAGLVMPDEDISRDLFEKYFKTCPVVFENIFLRWDKFKTETPQTLQAHRETFQTELDKQMLKLAAAEGQKSSDWWRRIGAVAVREGQLLLKAHNHHLPSPHTPYIDGDPRASFHKGVNLELSTAIHAEAALVAEAARRGLSLEGADLYLTTFPCPPCAKLIAGAGFRRLFYTDYYGVLDGERVLKDAGVELILVKK